MRYLLIILLTPTICLAQGLTEEEIAESLNISVYELRAQQLIQLSSELNQLKKAERTGQTDVVGGLTEKQKAELRTKRLAARTQLKNLCEKLGEVE